MGKSCSKKIDHFPKMDNLFQAFDAGHVETYIENEIREIQITENFSVLVSKYNGKFYAYGSKCPHYGASLINGAMVDGLVKCPWHGACFDVRTGDIEDSPGLDGIPTYGIEPTETGLLMVYPNNYGVYSVQRPLSKITDPDDIVMILGAGASGLSAAQTLRENGYEGRVVMVSRDNYMPYDRTKLSKSLGAEWENIKLKTSEWFHNAQIEIILNANILSVNFEEQHVTIDGHDKPLPYDKLLVATGSRPRIPPKAKGTNLKNVLTLYDIQDSAKIKQRCTGKDVLINGAGFIAMELLGPLSMIAKTITIISRSRRPYAQVLGDTLGRVIQQIVLKKYEKLTYIGQDEIREIIGGPNKEVKKVITLRKREIPCDVVIFAIGGVPNTDFLHVYKPAEKIITSDEDETTETSDEEMILMESPLGMQGDGIIPVSEYMETSLINHYACGDIVRFPNRASVQGLIQVSHWGMAQNMGRVAALKMLDIEGSIQQTTPFFWTSVAGLNLRYVGYGQHFNHTIIFGDLLEAKFLILYKRDWRILAGCTCNCDPIAARLSFDIQEMVEHDEGFYPKYITDVFPLPPVVGDMSYGVKYDDEFQVDEFDYINYRVKHNWLPRRDKFGEYEEYEDTDYITQPLITVFETLFYKEQQEKEKSGKNSVGFLEAHKLAFPRSANAPSPKYRKDGKLYWS